MSEVERDRVDSEAAERVVDIAGAWRWALRTGRVYSFLIFDGEPDEAELIRQGRVVVEVLIASGERGRNYG
jgi:hypothetical protein